MGSASRMFKAMGGVALALACAAVGASAQAPTIFAPGPGSNGKLDMVMLPDGVPFIVFQDLTSVKALLCADSACKSAASVFAVAPVTTTRVRVVLAADGLPLIGMSVTNNNLRVAKCENLQCSTATSTIVDPANLGSSDHAIVVAPDGAPLIAYHDALNQDLKFARCGDKACQSGNVVRVVDSAGGIGRAPSIAMISGLPQIAYQGAGTVRLALCGSLDCSVGTTFKTLGSDAPASTSIMAGRDGNAMIAFEADAALDSLKLVKCSSSGCAIATFTTIDALTSGVVGTGVGAGVQLREGADGLPVMSYFDKSFNTVKLARCTRPDCSSSTVTTVHAPVNSVISSSGATAALAISANGTPTLAYGIAGTGAGLTVHSCNTRSCQ